MKQLRNPDLQTKFNVGDVVVVPKGVAERLRGAKPEKQLARVAEVGPKPVAINGHKPQLRHTLTLKCCFGSVGVHEEWQLERLHLATPDQLTHSGGLPAHLRA